MPARAYRGVPLFQWHLYAFWSGVYIVVVSWGSSHCRPCSWKVRRWGTQYAPFAIGSSFFALNGAFCGWPGRGERLLRAKVFQGGAGAQNQVQSRAEYRCTLLSSSALSQ